MERSIPQVAILWVFFAVVVSAMELRGYEPVNDRESRTAASPAYSLYTGTCSRSFRKIGSFDSIEEVFRETHEQRKSKVIWIATAAKDSEARNAINLIPNRRGALQLEGCSIYVVRDGAGLRLYAKTETIKEAEALVEQLTPTVQRVEIVYHLK